MKPSKRRDEAYLYDLKSACSTITERVKRRRFPDLVENGEFRDGIVLQLIIIGEVASKLTEATKHKYPGVPWRDMAGLRHILVHAYWTYDLVEIWNTVTKDIPELLSLLE